MKRQKLNLFIFLPNFSLGGAGNSIKILCKVLDKKKYNIYVISIGKCYYKKYLSNKVKYVFELKKTKTIFAIFNILKILKEYDPIRNNSIFLSNINYANVVSILFIKVIGKYKTVLIERTPYFELKIYYSLKDFIKKNIIKFFINYFYKKADAIIVNSSKSEKEFKKICKNNIYKIFSPVSKKKANEIKFKKKKKKIKLLTIGRLSREKNFSKLIKSISLIKNYNLSLDIYGEGNEYNKLKSEISTFNLNKKIKIKKFIKNHLKIYKKYDLFLSSSDFEGFPNVIAEAVKYNLPVISTDSKGGIYDILLNGKGGKILKNNTVNELKENIEYYIKNQKKFYLMNKISKKNINSFNHDKYKIKYEKLIDKINAK